MQKPQTTNIEYEAMIAQLEAQRNRALNEVCGMAARIAIANDTIAKLEAKIAELSPPVEEEEYARSD